MGYTKKLLSFALSAAMLLSIAACNKSNTPDTGSAGSTPEGSTAESGAAAGVIEVKFPTFLAGENVGAKFFLPQVERFNQKYEGQYKMIIEEVPQAAYADKIKQLSQQNKLPAMIHAPGSGGIDNQWFRTVAVANDMVYDLSSFINDNPDHKKLVIDDSLNFVTVDGKVVCLPLTAIRPCGIFYNSKAYTPEKPIRDMTMDEFISSLGDNKIAFQTADNGWTSGLVLSSFIAAEEGGIQLLKDNYEEKLYDYNNPILISAVGKLQALMTSNASSNSVGAAYADAANAFMSGNAALVANGPWMSGDFTPESSDKWSNDFDGADVRADLFPGKVGLVSARNYGLFWVANSASDAEKEAVLAFLSFVLSPEEQEAYLLAEGGSAPNLEPSEAFRQELAKTRVLADLDEATTSDTRFVPNVLEVFPNSIADVEFGKLLPKLADGSLTAEQFCQQLTEKAQAIKS